MAKVSLKLPINKNSKSTKSLERFKKLNFLVAGLALVQAVALLVLADSDKGALPVTTSFLTSDNLASSVAGSEVLVQGSSRLFDINIAYLLAGFLLATALGHLLSAVWLRPRYESGLKQKTNSIRWVQYTFSFGLAVLSIALLLGIQDISLLLAIFSLVAVANTARLLSERQNADSKKIVWTNYWFGLKAGLVNLVVFAIYAWGAEVYGSGLSAYLYFILATLVLGFVAVSLIMRLSYKSAGRWSDYNFTEQAYVVVSFLALSAIAWQVFAGALSS